MTENVPATEIAAPADVRVGDDNQSHIVDAFGDPWCESLVEMHDQADDVDCPKCIEGSMKRIVRWWAKRQHAAGYNDALRQFRDAMANPNVRKVTFDRAEGDGPYCQGWNDCMKDLVLSRIQDAATSATTEET